MAMAILHGVLVLAIVFVGTPTDTRAQMTQICCQGGGEWAQCSKESCAEIEKRLVCTTHVLTETLERVTPYLYPFDGIGLTLEYKTAQQHMREAADRMDRREADIAYVQRILKACKAQQDVKQE